MRVTWRRTPGVAFELQMGVYYAFYSLLMLPLASSLNNNTAFFNSTLNSSVIIRNNILAFQSNTFQRAFSFKTCDNGQLLYQIGQSGDEFSTKLINGSINIRWKSGSDDVDMTTNAQLNNNAWYILDLRNRLGVVTMEIFKGKQKVHMILLANSTYQSSLLAISLSGSEELVIGKDFTGCVREGPGVTFRDNTNVRDIEVDWSFNTCPLDGITCNSDEVPQRYCYLKPCQNNGVCVEDADGYTCQCPYLYNGTNCEYNLRVHGCSIDPCLNGGTCQSLTSGNVNYRCGCVQGFTGENCETNIDECEPKPCQSGVCVDGINRYYCNCSGSGYDGERCHHDIDECQTTGICGNGGTCYNFPGSYNCKCPEGFDGDNCSLPIDACASSPCKNGGTCVDEAGDYRCQCLQGYEGKQCLTDIDNCVGANCSGTHRICQDGINSYTCTCKPGYTEIAGNCEDINECASSPCFNGATCQNLENTYLCRCVAGYTGPRCESNIDECSSQPCQNGATCEDRVNDYVCRCAAGYEDKNCSSNIDDCIANNQPCKNGGTCIDKVNTYSCHCAAGWTGPTCEVNYNECASQPCHNGGTCNDQLNAYNCTCAPGWTGRQCTEDVDECASNPCQNGATCHNLPNAFNCSCAPGFTGSNCGININECQPNPCQNGGTCHDRVNGYECTCTPTYMGKNCSQLYNACFFRPCMNGASCSSVIGTHNYTCSCPTGFTDVNCSTNIDDCVHSPCTEPFVCYDLINDFKCACPLGMEGNDCRQDIDECLSSPCRNGGTCHNEVGQYRCECPQILVNLTKYGRGQKLEFVSGFTGVNCEVDIDECGYHSPSICLHNGSCTNTFGDYNCLCGSVYDGVYATGNNCELSTSYCESAEEVKGDPPACHNGGTCLPDENSFTCSCAAGFTDPRCKTNINECESNPCQYGGTCVDGIARYECICIPGITGTNCETDIDECESSPCQHGGKCIDHINGLDGFDPSTLPPGSIGYSCNCTDTGFNGTNCELNIDDCAPGPCQNGANCTDLIKDYNCTCYTGYQGKDCQKDINECESSPCQYNGTCLERSKRSTYVQVPSLGDFAYDRAAGYYCDCIPGITGVNCETNIDECINNTCQHGSTCRDRINAYDCLCAPGYKGDKCEIDIDECEVQPCQNGATCFDKVAAFECKCAPGYKGNTCNVEINECDEYLPCLNGATCIDKIADYQCSCSAQPDANNKLYSGKNCTVELTACIGNVACLNGATCIPYLKSELPTIEQGFECKCTPGFTGKLCSIATTFAFNGASSSVQRTLSQLWNNTIKFRFRTTLENVVLMLWSGNYFSTRIFAHIEIFEGSLYMGYIPYLPNHTISATYLHIPIKVNDGEWHEIYLHQFNETGIAEKGELLLRVISPQCPNNVCERQLNYLQLQITNPENELFFGNAGSLTKKSWTRSQTSFKGCMQDMMVNDKIVLEENNQQTIPIDLVPGCVRNTQCFTDTCSNRGVCKDMWDSFNCICNRRYLGNRCQEEFIPATFSKDNTQGSSAVFHIPPPQTSEIKNHVKVTFFIRTREHSGLMMYLGNDDSTFLTLELNNGKLASRLILCASTYYILYNSTVINDGQQHLIGVEYLANQKFQLLRDGNPFSTQTLPSSGSCPLDANQLIFGGEIPETLRQSGRFRRNSDVVTADGSEMPKLTLLNNYKGTIQDAEINNNKLIFFPSNTSVNSNFNLTSSTRVEANEVTDDMCTNQSPCLHNGTCSNVFFNDFSCACPRGFRGKNCDEIDFCDEDSCPSTATCNSLHNGFECISTALFNNTSQVEYTHKLQSGRSISDISIQMRTLVRNGLILFAQNGPYTLKIRIRGSKLQVLYQIGSEKEEIAEADYDVSDKELHTVTLRENTANMTLAITGPQRNISKDFTFAQSPTVNLTALITNKASNRKLRLGYYDGASEDWFYKGCLGEVRIGGVLLPFYVKSEFTNYNTSVYLEYFEAVEVSVQKHKCSTDGSCSHSQCKHGSTCQEAYYDFKCHCPAGYSGKWCEQNTNDCTSPTLCGQGGKCVDEVNSFTCQCRGGYSGIRCDNYTNPCSSNLCLYGGECSDQGGTAVCNCTSDYTGHTCETPVNQTCSDSPCKNNATCHTETGKQPPFSCLCPDEYTGTLCDTKKNFCSDLPCLNEGTCSNDYSGNTYSCSCTLGYGGKNCSENINDCSSSSCQNNGICIDLVNDHLCNCTEGWNGTACEFDINECNYQPCQRGKCVNTPGSFSCNCVDDGVGYTGSDCGEDIDECTQESPCANGATCFNYQGGYNCTCTEGYKGKNCTEVDCDSVSCQNGGQCKTRPPPHSNKWMCECPQYVHGVKCETLGPCYFHPCEENNTVSSCTEISNLTDYSCSCKTEWQGKNCTEDVDECSGSSPPCHPEHSYNCTNVLGNYICYCNPGFTDKNCFTNINECSSVTCHNQGTCIDGINSYTCNCTSGWTNTTNCMEDINECSNTDLCQNGATCVNTPGSFDCRCEPGFIGELCAVKDPDFQKISQDDNVWIIVGPVVAGCLLLLVIGLILFLKVARKKRRTRGTYNPSRQEMNGSKLELGRVLKPPPEERLI